MDARTAGYPELPWLVRELAQLRAAHASGRFSHAFLIHAPRGCGGDWLAAWLARLVLCSNRQADAPCGLCIDCRRVLALQHPDLAIVAPEEDSQQIRIEQVRELAQELALTSHTGRAKVAVVTPADALNRFAANALLKTLEEPPPTTVLLLVAEQPSRLPATVRSRCQQIRVAPPVRNESLAWLAEHAGQGEWSSVLDTLGEAPLLAASLDAAKFVQLRAEVDEALGEALTGRLDAVVTAERWSRSELALRLSCFESWLTERIHAAAGVSGQTREVRPDTHLPAGHSLLNIQGLFGVLDGVRDLKSLLDTPVNKSLALEVLLRRMTGQERASQSR
jgi:DNA polymerase III subunit delta'